MFFPSLIFASDHAGVNLRKILIHHYAQQGLPYQERGSEGGSIDYPSIVKESVSLVLQGAAGIFICGSGIGMSIAANRFRGVRAALCHNVVTAQLSRQHNDANVLVLGARLITDKEALTCLDIFLTTAFEGGRHLRRVQALDQLGAT